MRATLFSTGLVLVLCAPSLIAQATSGPVTPPYTALESAVKSGYLSNTTSASRVVFKHRFFFKETAWLQFRFGEKTNLPTGSFLRMTAKDDGGVQRHTALTLAEWGMNSASFNGGEVLLELIAGPNTRANSVHVVLVNRGLLTHPRVPETICGSTDDRVKSNDKRQGRLWRGCTGWLIGPVSGGAQDLMLTAGHCRTSGTKILEFNVPDSSSTGSVRRAAPNDQYPYVELAGLSGSIGSDWAVCRVGKNSNTGKIPTGANGGVWYQLGAVPTSTSGQNITITGYGTTSPRNSLSQVQKIHTGPLSQIRSTSLCYSTDTSGGNSGSPVIHANTGKAIGIHTHGGCTSSGGCNQGTRIDRSDLQNAIKAAGKRLGSFVSFGTGCKGTGKTPPICASNNTNGGTLSNSTRTHEYAYIVTTTSAASVASFSLYCSSTTGGNVTLNTAIYADSNGSPAASPIATGTMTVGSTRAFYTSTISANLSAGRFYIAVNYAPQTVYLANLSTGASGGAYWRPTAGTGTWNLSGLVLRSSFRVSCKGGGTSNAVPQISSNGLPQIGSSFDVKISQGRANASAVLLTGGSNTTWSGGSLPFSLAGLGAPGCNLLVSPSIPLGATLNGSGDGSLKFTLANNSALVGLKGYHQWYVVDTGANALQVAVTAGAVSTVGG